MASHNELGKAGEDAAVAYLEKNEYVIRHRNWRKGHLELDIVAAKDNELIVVEVKTRSDTTVMQPEDAVTVQKIRHTVKAADTYIRTFQLTYREKKSFYFGRFPQAVGCNKPPALKKRKKTPRSPKTSRCLPLELLSRFELETSSLPRMRSTN